MNFVRSLWGSSSTTTHNNTGIGSASTTTATVDNGFTSPSSLGLYDEEQSSNPYLSTSYSVSHLLPTINHELDITEVFSRILIIGMPYRGITSKDSHRNNIDELTQYLNKQYGQHRYMVWNVANEDRSSGVAIEEKFRSQVLKFPPLLSESDSNNYDDGLPQIGELFKFVYTLAFWLDASPENVAIIHDTSGRQRSPFMVAAYLAWAHPGVFHDAVEAITRVMELRITHGKPVTLLPTWWRTLLSFDHLCGKTDVTGYAPRRIHLSTVLLYMSGSIRDHRNVRLEIYQGSHSVWDSDTCAGRYIDDYKYDEGCLKAVIDEDVCGDIQIHVSAEFTLSNQLRIVPTPTGDLPDMSTYSSSSVPLFNDVRSVRRLLVRYTFHTSALPSDVIQVPLTHVDVLSPSLVMEGNENDGIPNKDKFWMQMVLGEAEDTDDDENYTYNDQESSTLDSNRDKEELMSNEEVSFRTGGQNASSRRAEQVEQFLDMAFESSPSSSEAVTKPKRKPKKIKPLGQADKDAQKAIKAKELYDKMTSAHDFVESVEWLNLRGRAALLAGLYHFATAHSIFPSDMDVMTLTREFQLPRSFFAVVALQIAERNMEYARRVLRHPFIRHLVDPHSVSGYSLHNRRGSLLSLSIDKGGLDNINHGESGKDASLLSPAMLASLKGERNELSGSIDELTENAIQELHGLHSHTNSIIPVIATTMASILTLPDNGIYNNNNAIINTTPVGSKNDSGKKTKPNNNNKLTTDADMIAAHEEISFFLRQGLRAMLQSQMATENDNDEEESSLTHDKTQSITEETSVPSDEINETLSEDLIDPDNGTEPISPVRTSLETFISSTPSSDLFPHHTVSTSIKTSSKPPRPPTVVSTYPHTPSSSSVTVTDRSTGQLKSAFTTDTVVNSIGPSAPELLGLALNTNTPAKLRTMTPILNSIATSPAPSLYLAGLQLAAAVSAAERKTIAAIGAAKSPNCKLVLTHDDNTTTDVAPSDETSSLPSVEQQVALTNLKRFRESVQHMDPFVVRQLLTALQKLNETTIPIDKPSTTDSNTLSTGSMEGNTSTGSILGNVLSLGFFGSTGTESTVTGATNNTTGVSDPHKPSRRNSNSHGSIDNNTLSASNNHSASNSWISSAANVVVGGIASIVPIPLSTTTDVLSSTATNVPSSSSFMTNLPSINDDDDDRVQAQRAKAVQALAGVLAADPALLQLFEVLTTELGGQSASRRSATISSLQRAVNSANDNHDNAVIVLSQMTGSTNSVGYDANNNHGVGVSPPLVNMQTFLQGNETSIGTVNNKSNMVTVGNGTNQSSSVISSDSSTSLSVTPSPIPPVDASSVPNTADTTKYEKMLKMGIPKDAVMHKMRQDGISPEIMERVLSGLNGSTVNPPSTNPSTTENEKPSKDISILPPPTVTVDTHESTDSGQVSGAIETPSNRQALVEKLKREQLDAYNEAQKPLGEHILYNRYFKMLKVGTPVDNVKHSMVVAGLDPAILDMDAKQPHPQPFVPLKDDNTYAKYFKMRKFGLPLETVAHKLISDGLDDIVFELDPELPVPNSLTSSSLLARAQQTDKGGGKGPAKPRRLRKRLHWDILPADRKLDGTIWADTTNDNDDDSDFVDNEDEFLSLFTADPNMLPKTGAKNASTDAHTQNQKGPVLLIDSKRSRNVGIGLAKLRAPNDMIRNCLLNLTIILPDNRVLPLDALIVLEESLPTPEEINIVKGYKGDKQRLGEAEKFFLAVADVPKAKQRAAALAFQRAYDQRTGDVENRIRTLIDACNQVRSSQRLRRILEATLKIGNKLNTDDVDSSNQTATGKKRVIGFTLNSLLKLSQTKSFNGKTTVLAYLVSILNRKDPDALNVAEELTLLGTATHLDIRTLRDDVTNLKKDLSNVERLVREHVRTGQSLHSNNSMVSPLLHLHSVHQHNPSGGFPVNRTESNEIIPTAVTIAETSSSGSTNVDSTQATNGCITSAEDASIGETGTEIHRPTVNAEHENLNDFVARAQANLGYVSNEAEKAAGKFAELIAFFGEDINMSVETFFTTLKTFIRSIEKTQRELAEEEARNAREAKRQNHLTTVSNPSNNTPSKPTNNGTTLSPTAESRSGSSMIASRSSTHSVSTESTETTITDTGRVPNPHARLEALFKAKSNFYVNTGGPQLPPGTSATTSGSSSNAILPTTKSLNPQANLLAAIRSRSSNSTTEENNE